MKHLPNLLKQTALAAALGLVPFTAGAASDWLQWRGPLATGASPDATPPTTWSESQNVKWKAPLPGDGTASPIVVGDRIFVQTAIPTAASTASPAPARGGGGGGGFSPNIDTPADAYDFALICLDRATGKTNWMQVVRRETPHEGYFVGEGSLASQSPLSDGSRVYAFFGSRGLYCFDLDGKTNWSKDLGKMKIFMTFGEGSSAALSGNTLVVTWDHEGDSFIAAFDKNSGKELWRTPRGEKTSWATPLIVEHNGQFQVIADASKKVRSYDLADGKQIWECGDLTANVIPTPVAADGVVYSMSGYSGHSLLAIKLGRTGVLTGTDAVAWNRTKSTPYVPSPLLYNGRLYYISDNDGKLSCIEVKSGETLLDAERLEALPKIYASPVGAAGRVYLPGRNGKTVVLKDSGKLDILATNTLDDGFDSSPALAGKELYLRGHKSLYCLVEN